MQTSHKEKGFTLIELLVVIAIVAVLSVVVILTLNPAELLRQARDSNRVSDLGTLKTAIGVYLADVSTPFIGTSTNCYMSATGTASGCMDSFTGSQTGTSSASRVVTGTGWIPINFGAISSGSPLGSLPADPTNSGVYVYRYAASSTALSFEINAQLESTKYTDATTGLETTDGGSSSTVYEAGTNLSL
jgi:prepilin-type N-terminal cleavage/methylation domain-containing protein